MTAIPNDNHIARFCPARTVQGDDVSGDAFELKLSRNETYLSVNWMERAGEPDIESQLRVIKAAIRLEVKDNDRFARLPVGLAKERVHRNTRTILRIERIGTSHDTYSGIFDIPQTERANKAIGMQLAFVASGNLYRTIDPVA